MNKEKKQSKAPPPPYAEGATQKPIRICPRCKHSEYEGSKFLFCPIDGTQLQKPEELKDILNKKFTISQFIYQKQDEKWMFPVFLKELNDTGVKGHFTYIGGRNSDNSIDVYSNSIKSIDNYTAQMQHKFKQIHRIDNYETFYNNVMKLPCTYNPQQESLGDLLKSLIHYEITNPVCRQSMYFHCNLDCWTMGQSEDKLIEFSLLYNVHGMNASITRSNFPSAEDVKLKDALALITEDVFYNKRTREIYNLEDLLKMFGLEGKLFENFNFYDHSKHIKILNVNAYILNEEIETLFEFMKIREWSQALCKLKSRKNTIATLLILLGFNDLDEVQEVHS